MSSRQGAGAGAAGMSGVYTIEEIRSYTPLLAQLPMATENSGIITLAGGSGFNPAPILNQAWLKGVLQPTEYEQAIASINEAIMQSLVGQSKSFPPSEIPVRESRKAAAAQEAVNRLNAQYNSKGVYFTYQQGATLSTMTNIGSQHRTETFLYIRIDSAEGTQS